MTKDTYHQGEKGNKICNKNEDNNSVRSPDYTAQLTIESISIKERETSLSLKKSLFKHIMCILYVTLFLSCVYIIYMIYNIDRNPYIIYCVSIFTSLIVMTILFIWANMVKGIFNNQKEYSIKDDLSDKMSIFHFIEKIVDFINKK